MYHHAKRPTPFLWCIAGGICALGIVAITARILHNFTTFKVAEPFDGLTFAVAVACLIVGPLMLAWLKVIPVKQRIAELEAENKRLHKECDEREDLAAQIRRCDEQAEVTTVLVRKILKHLEEKQIPLGDTQDIPKVKLHRIDGGGGA